MVACAPVQKKIAEIKAHRQLEQYREKLANGFFETIILEGKQILEKNETEPPADIAFYALGEVYAHHDFAGKDLVVSKYYFEKLSENFPDSPLTPEAKTYISFFEMISDKEKETIALKRESLKKEKSAIIQNTKTSATVSRKIVENQNFNEAIIKNEQILAKAGNKKPADEALYNLGLIYAHAENPDLDYKKSQLYFIRLTEQFPDSEFTEEAQVMLGLFETIEKIQQIDIEIDQQKKELTR